MEGCLNRRVLVQRDRDGILQCPRQERVDRPRSLESPWLDADDLAVVSDTGLQVGLRREIIRASRRQARFGLGNVRPRHLADVESVAGLPQLLFEHRDVVLVELEDGRVAQHIHVSGGAVLQRILLGVARLLARLEDLRFGLANAVCGAISVEDVLRDGQRGRRGEGARVERSAPPAWRSSPRRGRRRRRVDSKVVVGPVETGRSRPGDLRAIGRLRAGDSLVGRPRARALLVEIRIAGVGAREGARDRLGGDSRRHRPEPRSHTKRSQERPGAPDQGFDWSADFEGPDRSHEIADTTGGRNVRQVPPTARHVKLATHHEWTYMRFRAGLFAGRAKTGRWRKYATTPRRWASPAVRT